MFFGDVALSIPKTIVDKRMADYQEMRKAADELLYGRIYNNPNTGMNKGKSSWQSMWSDTPCTRLWYGGSVSSDPVMKNYKWWDLKFYMLPSSNYWIGGNQLHQIGYEYCHWDTVGGYESSGPYGENGYYSLYLKLDYSTYTDSTGDGFNVGNHVMFWATGLSIGYERLIHATNMMNLFNKKYYENGKVMHPTDDTGFIPS